MDQTPTASLTLCVLYVEKDRWALIPVGQDELAGIVKRRALQALDLLPHRREADIQEEEDTVPLQTSFSEQGDDQSFDAAASMVGRGFYATQTTTVESATSKTASISSTQSALRNIQQSVSNRVKGVNLDRSGSLTRTEDDWILVSASGGYLIGEMQPVASICCTSFDILHVRNRTEPICKVPLGCLAFRSSIFVLKGVIHVDKQGLPTNVIKGVWQAKRAEVQDSSLVLETQQGCRDVYSLPSQSVVLSAYTITATKSDCSMRTASSQVLLLSWPKRGALVLRSQTDRDFADLFRLLSTKGLCAHSGYARKELRWRRSVINRLYLTSSGYDLSFPLPSLPTRPVVPVPDPEALNEHQEEHSMEHLDNSTPGADYDEPLFGSHKRAGRRLPRTEGSASLSSANESNASLQKSDLLPSPGLHPPMILPRVDRRVRSRSFGEESASRLSNSQDIDLPADLRDEYWQAQTANSSFSAKS